MKEENKLNNTYNETRLERQRKRGENNEGDLIDNSSKIRLVRNDKNQGKPND